MGKLENKLNDTDFILEMANKILLNQGMRVLNKNPTIDDFACKLEYFCPENKLFLSKEIYDSDEKKIENASFFIYWKEGRKYQPIFNKFNSKENPSFMKEGPWKEYLLDLYNSL